MKNSIDIDYLRKMSLEESDRISSSSHHVDVDWDLGNGDFTIEAWIPPEAIDNEIAVGGHTNISLCMPFWLYIDADLKSIFRIYALGGAWAVEIHSATPMFTAGAWAHVAMSRQGDTVSCWVNGVSAGTAPISGAAIVKSFNGHIEELRITQGVARYTAAFTPATAEFPDQDRTSINPLPTDRALFERPIGWLWRARSWFRRLLCQHNGGRLVAIEYDGTTVHECVTCGKLIRRSL